ncbi:MAG: hypothetical protein A2075_07595 [Geobacteraceae bacterium GWC2_58_44]|nr:MAG: hypothetical protein A2075_07595 [Geobacteraceae bacterium GWC2_58_44]
MSVISRTFSTVSLLVFATTAIAATQADIDQARNKGLAWLYISQKGDGSWRTAGGLEIQPTAAVLEALLNAGVTRGRAFAMAQSWLTNADSISTDSLSRQGVALYKAGANVTALMTRLTGMRHLRTNSWGAYDQYYGSFPDTSLALDAFSITKTTFSNTGFSLGFIAASQNTDGGWSYTSIYGEPGTSVSRVVPTAHNIITLSRYNADWIVDTNITNGINFLFGRQKADGGFAGDLAATVGSPYETALVYLALNEAKNAGNATAVAAQTVMANARNFLISQQQTDGCWNDDPFMTALVLQTLPTATLSDSDNDGIPDAIEALLLTNPIVADGRNLVKGNGDSVPGINSSVLLATILVYRPFSMSLTVSGGTAPYSWSLVSGGLPSGLSLGSSNGIICGTPVMKGAFNFFYKVSDTTGLSTSTMSQIMVESLPILVTTPTISYFDTLQSAYAAQSDGGTVTMLVVDGTMNEGLTLDRNVIVTLAGGYDDIFTNRTGATALAGPLTIIGGSVTVNGIYIK